jgi:hypothetical protein
MKAITVLRLAGQHIPANYLSKLAAEYNSGLSFAKSSLSGKSVVIRRFVSNLTPEQIEEIVLSDKLKDDNVVFNFFQSSTALSEEDISPYVILAQPLAEDSTKVLPSLVAFLNGDFSQFKKDGEHSAEYNCVYSQMIPRIKKFHALYGGDIGKLMGELKDDLTTSDFGNMMSGENGSIVFVGAGKDNIYPITLANDKINNAGDGYWTSNSLEEQEVIEEVPEVEPEKEDDLLGDLDDEGGAVIPTEKAPPPKPAEVKDNGKKNSLGIPSRTKANETPAPKPDPVAAPDKPDVRTGKDVQRDAKPSVPSDLTDPNARLTLIVPTGLDQKKRSRWFAHRMPEALVPKSTAGIKSITLSRSDCNSKFMADFLTQENLSGMDVLKYKLREDGPATSSAPVIDTQTTKVSVPGVKKEAAVQVHSPAATAAARDNKDTSTKHVTNVTSAVTFTEPQVAHMKTFVEDKTVKESVAKQEQLLNSPSGMETLEKQIADISKQFGGKVNILNVASWPLDVFMKYVQNDPSAGSKLGYSLAVELVKAYKMMDELTGPHEKKQEAAKVQQEAIREPQVLEAQAAAKPGTIAFPKRRTA